MKNLRKSYNGKLVLNIDYLEFKKGRITALMGPNGTGKTTLLNIIGGLDHDYHGTIEYDDRVLNNNIQKNITMLFQSIRLFKRSVYENIEYPLKIRRVPKRDRQEKILKIMQEMGISHLKDKNGYHLSGGEMQKVALARSMVFSPGVLLLDEPISSLDSQSVEIFEKQVLRYNRKTGNTIIYITHDLQAAKKISHDLVYLDNGRIRK